MVVWPPMPLLKPFRALRYDTATAGPLDALVAPPHDVLTPEERDRLLVRSAYNAVRLVRPDRPADAAACLADWRASGVLVRDARPAVWLLEEDFTGPDGLARTRRGLVARVRLEPYANGRILPHEKTFPEQKEARLELLRATNTKLSPILLLHEGRPPAPAPSRPPDVEASLDGVTSRLWRVEEVELEAVRGSLIIADGHHRYESARRYHEEAGTPESAYALAALVSRRDPGLTIFPTHRLASEPAPALNGGLRQTPVEPGEAVVRLEAVDRDHAAFVLVRRDGAVLAEQEPAADVLDVLDTTLVDALVPAVAAFTPSAADAVAAVRSGAAGAAYLVRPPTMAQVEAVAVAGETMPQKSTYFFPKLTSGLLFAPFDE